ncbi:MAG TPA: methyltransferase domain-containing protein [Mycobacteriales bacterium]|nr:methyltransferase domain-containing protein [Mycobacteriales bacterium]HVX69303.1 methyltransferase domain-containing protein [Mycobacteriales bacterium]
MSADRRTHRNPARTAVLWEVLRGAFAAFPGAPGEVSILDVGGGTGGFAVPLAELGYSITVIDPSPDSLAALERRAMEAGVAQRVTARQGDAGDVAMLLDGESVVAVLCHSVLEVVDDPMAALQAFVDVLRPGGIASVLVANRVAATLARVASGRLGEARAMLAGDTGVSGPHDPLRRRFTADGIQALVADAGLRPVSVHGIRIFADSAPTALLEGDVAAAEELVALEHAVATDPSYLQVATSLHVLAEKPS